MCCLFIQWQPFLPAIVHDLVEKALAEVGHFFLANAAYAKEGVGCPRSCSGHFAQCGVVEDDISRHTAFFGDLAAQGRKISNNPLSTPSHDSSSKRVLLTLVFGCRS